MTAPRLLDWRIPAALGGAALTVVVAVLIALSGDHPGKTIIVRPHTVVRPAVRATVTAHPTRTVIGPGPTVTVRPTVTERPASPRRPGTPTPTQTSSPTPTPTPTTSCLLPGVPPGCH